MLSNPSQRRATLIGTSAILMWATLALLTELSGAAVPAFQLTA
ncbi:MAG: EamA family transporter, partial [Cyanobacteria bacterium J06576_12]